MGFGYLVVQRDASHTIPVCHCSFSFFCCHDLFLFCVFTLVWQIFGSSFQMEEIIQTAGMLTRNENVKEIIEDYSNMYLECILFLFGLQLFSQFFCYGIPCSKIFSSIPHPTTLRCLSIVVHLRPCLQLFLNLRI